jgi:hypothetical protein
VGFQEQLQGGVKSYITDTLAVLDQVNNTRDPIQALNALQGWTDTRAPAPVVSGKTNYNIPYDSSKDGRINPAPVVSGKDNYNTPYGGSTSSGKSLLQTHSRALISLLCAILTVWNPV